MGNIITNCCLYKKNKENNKENNNPMISGRYCYKCNTSFENKKEYHNHIPLCEPRLRGDL